MYIVFRKYLVMDDLKNRETMECMLLKNGIIQNNLIHLQIVTHQLEDLKSTMELDLKTKNLDKQSLYVIPVYHLQVLTFFYLGNT